MIKVLAMTCREPFRRLTYLPIYLPLQLQDVEEHFRFGQLGCHRQGTQGLVVEDGEKCPQLVRHVEHWLKWKRNKTISKAHLC